MISYAGKTENVNVLTNGKRTPEIIVKTTSERRWQSFYRFHVPVLAGLIRFPAVSTCQNRISHYVVIERSETTNKITALYIHTRAHTFIYNPVYLVARDEKLRPVQRWPHHRRIKRLRRLRNAVFPYGDVSCCRCTLRSGDSTVQVFVSYRPR